MEMTPNEIKVAVIRVVLVRVCSTYWNFNKKNIHKKHKNTTKEYQKNTRYYQDRECRENCNLPIVTF